jgi:signal transduction histidine kinase
VRTRTIAVGAYGLLLVAFIADILTPQTLVVAITLDIPIVLAVLTRSRRLTAGLVTLALIADGAAAVVNAARDGTWSGVGVGDRVFSMLSIILVGYLATAVQDRAERVGRLSVQESRSRREATLAHAAEAIRSTLSEELVLRALVREAPLALGLERARWFPYDDGEPLEVRYDGDEVATAVDEAPAEVLAFARRALEEEHVIILDRDDPVGGLTLERLAAAAGCAIPIRGRERRYGTLVVAGSTRDEHLYQTSRALGRVAVDALEQAGLFARLAERNDALDERQAVIQDLVSAISHDVRTPLAALAVTLRHAQAGAYGELPAAYREVVATSVDSIEDLQHLAETLLLVARFEAGDRQPDRERFDLALLARAVADEFTALAATRGVTLSVAGESAAPAFADRADVRRAATNLVVNALHHTPRGGNVVLTVSLAASTVLLAVADDGYGVEAAARATLFSRFAARGRIGGGTGLGLYIVRRIAEESGGTVRYEAVEPRGSCFTLALPAAA